jgi:hypothetical protein
MVSNQWQEPMEISYKDCGLVNVTGFYWLSMNTVCKITGLDELSTYKINVKVLDDLGNVTRGTAIEVSTKGRLIANIPTTNNQPGGPPRISVPVSDGMQYTNKVVISKLSSPEYMSYIPLILGESSSFETQTVFDLSFVVKDVTGNIIRKIDFPLPETLDVISGNAHGDNLNARTWNGTDQILVPNPVIIDGLTPNTDYYVTLVVSERFSDLNQNPASVQSEVLHIKTLEVTT